MTLFLSYIQKKPKGYYYIWEYAYLYGLKTDLQSLLTLVYNIKDEYKGLLFPLENNYTNEITPHIQLVYFTLFKPPKLLYPPYYYFNIKDKLADIMRVKLTQSSVIQNVQKNWTKR